MADDDIEVLVEEEPPVEEKVEVVEAKPAAKTAPTKPEDGVEVLKQQLEAANLEKQALATRVQATEQREVAARTEVQQTNVQLVEGAIARVKQNLEVLEGQVADAYAAGDFAAVAKLQTRVARSAAEQLTLENGLEQLKAAPKPQPAAPADPVEAFAATLTAPAAAWIRAHPDYVRDSGKNARLVAAHNMAVAEGHALDSDGYFGRVEGLLGVARATLAPKADPSGDSAMSDGAQAAGGRNGAPPPAAPARNGGNGAPRTIRLTRDQVEAAAISGMTPQEYAKMLAKIEREKSETLQ